MVALDISYYIYYNRLIDNYNLDIFYWSQTDSYSMVYVLDFLYIVEL